MILFCFIISFFVLMYLVFSSIFYICSGCRLLRVTICVHIRGLISVLGGKHFFVVMCCLRFPTRMHFFRNMDNVGLLILSHIACMTCDFLLRPGWMSAFHMLHIAIVLGRNPRLPVSPLTLSPSGKSLCVVFLAFFSIDLVVCLRFVVDRLKLGLFVSRHPIFSGLFLPSCLDLFLPLYVF